MIPTESQSIEVEVLEIDGAATPARSESRGQRSPQRPWKDWQKWQSRLRRLDSKWWPLWVFMGSIALVLILTFGLVIGVMYMVFRILTGLLRVIFR